MCADRGSNCICRLSRTTEKWSGARQRQRDCHGEALGGWIRRRALEVAVPADDDAAKQQAVASLRQAAEQDYAYGMLQLGLAYGTGDGVPQDYVQAHMWVNLAASRFAVSQVGRERAIKSRDLVAAKMTPAQIAEAQKLAREWKPKPKP